MIARGLFTVAALAASATAGCLPYADDCGARRLVPGEERSCATPGWTDRAFDVRVPPGWDGASLLPVVLVFHGGGGNRGSADRVTCPGGDEGSPECLAASALSRGFAVATPDGTGGRPLRGVRTWNAGGGRDGLDCVSGAACASGVDDLAYVGDVLAELGAALPLDGARLYATGLSNGGAISHRLACELSTPLAAIAAVGGANQHAEGGGACGRSAAVLQLHGTEDPCWRYDGGQAGCIDDDGRKVSVADTMEGWRVRNGCAAGFIDSAVADADPSDGVTVVHRVWQGCARATELYRLDGAGHTWPSGWSYLGEDRIGKVGRDLDSGAILDFFEANRAR